MRAIDADKLKKSIDACEICNVCPDKRIRCDYDCDAPDYLTPKWEALIDAQPTIEPKRGEWIYQESCGSDRYDDYRCSNCGTLITVDSRSCDDIGFVIEDFRRCLNCGAYMRGTDDE